MYKSPPKSGTHLSARVRMVPEKPKLSQVLEGEGRPAVTVGDRLAERLKRALIISGFPSGRGSLPSVPPLRQQMFTMAVSGFTVTIAERRQNFHHAGGKCLRDVSGNDCLGGTPVTSPDGGRCGLTCRLAALTAADCGLAWPQNCGRWLPVRLPKISCIAVVQSYRKQRRFSECVTSVDETRSKRPRP